MKLVEDVQRKTDKAVWKSVQACTDDQELSALISYCEGVLHSQGFSVRVGHFRFESLHELIETARQRRRLLRTQKAQKHTMRWAEILEKPYTDESMAHHDPEKRYEQKTNEEGPDRTRPRVATQRTRRGKQRSSRGRSAPSGS